VTSDMISSVKTGKIDLGFLQRRGEEKEEE
jgi:hypothetical protein